MAATIRNADAFFEVLDRSGLLGGEDVQAARKAAGHLTDVRAIVRCLVQQGYLTAWQAARLRTGRRPLMLGRFTLLDRLDWGDPRRFFRAKDAKTQQQFTLKTLRRQSVEDADSLERFHEEGRRAAALDHPNIVRVLDYDFECDHHFLVMEYVEARTLQHVAAEEPPLPCEDVARYVHQAAAALAYGHEQGVTHGDLKPSSLLLDAEGTVKLFNFAAAQSAGAASDAGHRDAPPPYGSETGMCGDIAALGRTFYLLLTGEIPLSADDRKIRQRLLRRRADAPPELTAVCLKMLASNPRDRFQTAGEVAAVLAEWLGDDRGTESPLLAEPPASPSDRRLKVAHRRRIARAERSRRLQLGFAASAGALLLIGAAVAVSLWPRAEIAKIDGGLRDALQENEAANPAAPTPAKVEDAVEKNAAVPIVDGSQPVGEGKEEPVVPGEARDKRISDRSPPAKPKAETIASDTVFALASETPDAPEEQPPEAGEVPHAPLGGLVEAIDLPEVPSPDSIDAAPPVQVVLGELDAEVDLEIVDLLGRETALAGKPAFRLRAVESGWEIALVDAKKADAAAVVVARVSRSKGRLLLAWTREAGRYRQANHLRNCTLHLASGDERRKLALRKPVEVEPLTIDLEKGRSTAILAVVWPPDPRTIHVELTALEGAFPTAAFPDGAVMPASRGTIGVDCGYGEKLLHVKLASKMNRQLQLTLSPFYQPPGEPKARLLTIASFSQSRRMVAADHQRLKALAAQLKSIQRKVKDKELNKARRAAVDGQIVEAEAVLEGLNELELYCKDLHDKGRVHFRVFSKAGDYELDLVRTRVPEEGEAGVEE